MDPRMCRSVCRTGRKQSALSGEFRQPRLLLYHSICECFLSSSSDGTAGRQASQYRTSGRVLPESHTLLQIRIPESSFTTRFPQGLLLDSNFREFHPVGSVASLKPQAIAAMTIKNRKLRALSAERRGSIASHLRLALLSP